MFSPEQIKLLKEELDVSLVKDRVGGGGAKLNYLEGYTYIDQANRIFGFDGWSMELKGYRIEGRLVIARVMITVQLHQHQPDGTRTWVRDVIREDIGCQEIRKDDAASLELAVKGAVTDAMKRALRTFGNQFGNSLYDKEWFAGAKREQSRPRVSCSQCGAQIGDYTAKNGKAFSAEDVIEQTSTSPMTGNQPTCMPCFLDLRRKAKEQTEERSA